MPSFQKFTCPIWALAAVAILFQVIVFSNSSSISTPAPKKAKCHGEIDKEVQNKWNNATVKCASTNAEQLEISAIINFNKTLEELDPDDKCVFKCIYEEVDLLEEDNKPKKNQIDFFKGNLTQGMKTKLNTIWNECIDKAEKISKDKNFPKDNCKLVALHNACCTRRIINDNIFETCD